MTKARLARIRESFGGHPYRYALLCAGHHKMAHADPRGLEAVATEFEPPPWY